MLAENFARAVAFRASIRGVLLVGSAIPAIMVSGQAAAQTTPTQSTGTVSTAPAELASDEIVVTATKRAGAELLKDVPSAISVISADVIADTHSDNLGDLGKFAPNVQLAEIGTFNGFSNFVIRGVGINTSTRTVDPAVGIFVNGMYVGLGASAVSQSFDIGSIEVLRGPQGTLFGRNVTGGAVVINTRRPGNDYAANAKITVGSEHRFDVEGGVDVPIGDLLSVRLAAMSKKRDGYYTNLENGKTVGDIDIRIFRPTVVFKPSDRFTLTVIGEHFVDQSGTGNTRDVIDPIRPKLAQTLLKYIPPPGRFDIRTNTEGRLDARIDSITGQMDLHIGGGTVTSITGYRDLLIHSTTDLDSTPFLLFEFPKNFDKHHQFIQELRYAANFSDRLSMVVGANYYKAHLESGERRQILTTTNIAGLTIQNHESYGIFGEVTFNINPDLSLRAGGRYTHEKKDIAFSPVGTCALDFSTCKRVFRSKTSDSDFSPRVAVNYKLNPEVSLYASYSQGFRSQGYNSRAQRVETLGPAQSEKVTAYEAGAKTELFDRRIRFNLAGFYTVYDNLQLFVNSTFAPPGLPPSAEQVLTNARGATIYGIEAELSAQVTPKLLIGGNLGYVRPKFKPFDFNQTFGVDVNFDGKIDSTDAALAQNLRFVRVPQLEYTVTGIYRQPIGDDALTARVDYSWQGKLFYNFRNTPQSLLPSYGLLNASLTYEFDNPDISLSLFGKNLTKANFYDFREEVGTLYLAEVGGAPRTWGISLGVNF